MGQHEAGVHSGVDSQEGGQALRPGRVHEPVGATLRDGGQIGQGDGTEVGGEGQGLAVEILCAAQALELRELSPSPETQAVLRRLRAEVPPLPVDRFLAPDLATAERLVGTGELLPGWLD